MPAHLAKRTTVHGVLAPEMSSTMGSQVAHVSTNAVYTEALRLTCDCSELTLRSVGPASASPYLDDLPSSASHSEACGSARSFNIHHSDHLEMSASPSAFMLQIARGLYSSDSNSGGRQLMHCGKARKAHMDGSRSYWVSGTDPLATHRLRSTHLAKASPLCSGLYCREVRTGGALRLLCCLALRHIKRLQQVHSSSVRPRCNQRFPFCTAAGQQ